MSINASEELLKAIPFGNDIERACIQVDPDYDSCTTYYLDKYYLPEDYKKFFELLDFEYENGFGRQRLDGTVWLADGSWLERGEYDGSEWWEWKRSPDVPEFFRTLPVNGKVGKFFKA